MATGAERGRARAAQGLPWYTDREIEQRRKWSQQATRRRFVANIEFVSQYKLLKGCAECGYNAHSAALDFDHLPGFEKVMSIAQLTPRTLSKLLAEIEKCEVVCANCHRIRTAERRSTSGHD